MSLSVCIGNNLGSSEGNNKNRGLSEEFVFAAEQLDDPADVERN